MLRGIGKTIKALLYFKKIINRTIPTPEKIKAFTFLFFIKKSEREEKKSITKSEIQTKTKENSETK